MKISSYVMFKHIDVFSLSFHLNLISNSDMIYENDVNFPEYAHCMIYKTSFN